MGIHPFIFLGLGALGFVVATSEKPVPGIVEAKPGETYLLTLRAVGAKVTQDQANAWGASIASVGKLDSIVVNDSGDTVAAVITYDKPTHIVLNQLVALTTTPDKGLMVTEAKLQPDFSKIPNAPVPAPAAPPKTSPTPSTPAQKPTPAGQPWPWVAASEQMMMQAGNEYEMRPTVLPITLTDLFDQHLSDGTLTSSRIPIVLIAQQNGTMTTALGIADGVTGIRFRWIGDTGLATFPPWAVRDMEIRPAIG